MFSVYGYLFTFKLFQNSKFQTGAVKKERKCNLEWLSQLPGHSLEEDEKSLVGQGQVNSTVGRRVLVRIWVCATTRGQTQIQRNFWQDLCSSLEFQLGANQARPNELFSLLSSFFLRSQLLRQSLSVISNFRLRWLESSKVEGEEFCGKISFNGEPKGEVWHLRVQHLLLTLTCWPETETEAEIAERGTEARSGRSRDNRPLWTTVEASKGAAREHKLATLALFAPKLFGLQLKVQLQLQSGVKVGSWKQRTATRDNIAHCSANYCNWSLVCVPTTQAGHVSKSQQKLSWTGQTWSSLEQSRREAINATCQVLMQVSLSLGHSVGRLKD